MSEIINISHMDKVYHTENGDFTALKDISLSVNQGEIFGIIGLSGAGKSTLVRCINFLEKPTAGTVTVGGRNMAELKPKELLKTRQSMGMIFQSFNLLSQRTSLGNILYPMEIAGYPRAKAVARAKELLGLVGLSDKEKSYPSQLSGGQKQRVAIARALATSPKLLLCDEATSALDPTTTYSILELLKEINRTLGVTIIVITHEMRVIETICNRVAVIDKSHIVEMGEVQEVFIHPKSAIAKELILPHGEAVPNELSSRCLRVVFDGRSSFEPVLSTMILECRAAVNILYAHTKNIDGKAVGQMLFQLPQDEATVKRVKAFFDERKIPYSEEDAT